MMTKSTAPIVLMTPVSRVLSNTLMLIAPVKPMLPTNAVKIAIINRKLIKVLSASFAFSRISYPD